MWSPEAAVQAVLAVEALALLSPLAVPLLLEPYSFLVLEGAEQCAPLWKILAEHRPARDRAIGRTGMPIGAIAIGSPDPARDPIPPAHASERKLLTERVHPGHR
jgi:hypothetical protein